MPGCSTCGNHLSPTSRKCPECGAALAATAVNGKKVVLAIVGGLVLFMLLILATGYYAAQVQHQLRDCRQNLARLDGAMQASARSHGGSFPRSLAELMPTYLPSIPTCPAARSNTYEAGFLCASDARAYTIVCSGHHHGGARQGANFPQYTSGHGPVSQ